MYPGEITSVTGVTLFYAVAFLALSRVTPAGAVCDQTKGCFPTVFDVLSDLSKFPARSLATSSVCGEKGVVEKYMTFLGSDFTQYTCAPATLAKESMVDENSATYWQSSVGTEMQFVEARFTDKFTLFDVIVKFSVPHLTDITKSADARPLAWSINKLADDGTTWVPLRHYAKDCATSFPGIAVLDPYATNDYNVVFCEQYAPVSPTEDFPDFKNRISYYPGRMDVYAPFLFRNDPSVAEYFTTSGVRISFQDVKHATPMQHFVAIGQLILDVRCQCNGHADVCNGPNQATCDCQHSTTGKQCESCLRLYNNQLWTRGNTTSPGACQKCSCNSHAVSCLYDNTKTHGVCQDCQDNTAGDFCDTCAAGHYVNASWTSASDVEKGGAYCLPCQCDVAGTLPDQLATCDMKTGQCTCKTNVQGRDCSQCKDTFYGLSAENNLGCAACVCNQMGTIGDNSMCNKTDGACLCRANVQGTSCDACKPNTYGFNAANPDGCIDCACDLGASLSQSCDVSTGMCRCRDNIGQRDCKTPNTGNFVPRLDLIVIEPETMVSEDVVLRDGHGTEGATSSGRGLVRVTSAKNIVLTFTAGYGGKMDFAIRYEKTTEANLVYLEGTLSLTSTGSYSCGDTAVVAGKTWPLSKTVIGEAKTGAAEMGTVCLGRGSTYSIELKNSATALLIDSIVFIPEVESLKTASNGWGNVALVERCHNEALSVLRQNRQDCKGLEYSLMATYLYEAQACSCPGGSLAGPVCDIYSGDCSCKTGVLPPHCDVCLADFYQFSLQTGCTGCQCHVNGSMTPFCTDLGICQCHPNVQGNKCDSCATDHFGLHTGKGCLPCQCNPTYSTGTGCDDYGQCACKPGVGGAKCDRCAHGHFQLTSTGCTPCGCDVKGSTGLGCDVTTGLCQCRDNVQGKACDTCKNAFYGLGDWHQGGCIPCFCWGKGDNCTSAPNLFDNPIKSSIASLLQWTAVNSTDGPVGVKSVTPGYIKIDPLEETGTNIYFVALAKYQGDRSSSYGRDLTLVVMSATLPSAPDTPVLTTLMDVVLEGAFAAKALKHSMTIKLDNTVQSFTIPMRETSWLTVDKSVLYQTDQPASTQAATFDLMMRVLADVSTLKIQAYNAKTAGYTVVLASVMLDAGHTGPATSVKVNNVEMCQCPDGYTGIHCEACATGFTRATPNNPDPKTQCVACSCNGHAQHTCDNAGQCVVTPCNPVSGMCVCSHNTEGNTCQTCKTGYYGDPTKGTPDDCLPCACPGIVVNKDVNAFATSCVQNEAGAPVCSGCTEGHKGDHCEICVDGYFGTPENATNAGGKCQACVCNGRADTCDPRTGQCASCRNNTAGHSCEICAPGYHGDAMTFSCQECVCKNYPGSTGQCDPATGTCQCLSNVGGSVCDQCLDGSFNLQALTGCQLCGCHGNGSTSAVCDKVTGQCPCRTLVEGRQCDACQDSYWNINILNGCDQCNCNEQGTKKDGGVTIKSCDVMSGQCQCALPGTIGRTCDACSPVTKYNLTYVELFYIGAFPQCQLCGECFDSWGLTIDDLGKKAKAMDDQSKTIWQQFGNQTPDQIGSRLTVTEEKIQKANESAGAFEDLAQSLMRLQNRFNQAKTKDTVLNSRATILSDREKGLKTQLATLELLTDTIQLTVSTTTSVVGLQTQLDTHKTNTQSSKRVGVSAWESVQTLSFVVADPEDKGRQLQQQADSSMKVATLANQTYQLARILYENSLKLGSEDNTETLKNMAKQHTEATSKLTAVSATDTQVTNSISQVTSALTSLVGAAEKSRTDTLKMVVDLQIYVTNSSIAQQHVAEVKKEAGKLLADSQKAETTMRISLTTILENLAALTRAQSDLVSSQVQSTGILSVSLRPLSELQAVMANIKSSSISSSDVQAVELKAQKALVLAEQALQDTQKALGLVRDVKQEVGIMEEDIKASQNTRTQSQGLMDAADLVKGEIDATLTKVGSHVTQTTADMTQVTSSTAEIVTKVGTISTCLTEGEVKVTDATSSASRSEERAQTTSKNQEVLIQLMVDINTESADQTVSQALNTLTQGSAVLTDLADNRKQVEALTDLKVLVQDLVAQVQEINTLDGEVNGLTSELDGLLLALRENVDTGTSCNTAV